MRSRKSRKQLNGMAEAAEKAGFEHFMIKEIHEQPKAVRDTLNSVLKDDRIDLSEVGLTDEEIKKISQIYIVSRVALLPCGNGSPVCD